MTVVDRRPDPAPRLFTDQVDLDRWPDMRPPPPSPGRAMVARILLRKVAHQTGVRVTFPDGSAYGPSDGPRLVLRRPEAFLTRVGRDGKIGFGESYMAGDWDSDDLSALLTAMARHLRSLVPPALQWVRRWYEPRLPASEDNDSLGSRRNVARHYDLSNQMFSLFLDETMTYSSAWFVDPDEPLVQAQHRKIDHLLDAARIGAGSRVLEVGTGWGELAIRAARRGARVTTLTLSHEQAALARRRIAAEGLEPNADVVVQDYRRSSGRYDAVVSVEMIEAVGQRWWPTYFQTLEQRLAPGGRIALQSILMHHEGMRAAAPTWSWINKYIFPGGMIPSLEAIEATVAAHTGLDVVQRHHFGLSYAETLRRWRRRFSVAATQLEAIGFDRTFQRMWDFYLAYSEAGFRSGYLDVAQLVIAPKGTR